MLTINLSPTAGKRRGRGGGGGARSSIRMPQLSGMPVDPWMAGMGGAGTLLLLWLGFGFWQTGQKKTELQAKIDAAVQDSTRLQRTIALMDELQARQDTIERKIGVIEEVDGRRYVYPHLLDEISRAVPQYTWLTKLATTDEGPAPAAPPAPANSSAAPAPAAAQGPGFTLEGNTGTAQALTRLIRNLEASPFIRDVNLVTSTQESQQGRTYQKFTLEGRYEQPDSAAIQTVPVVIN